MPRKDQNGLSAFRERRVHARHRLQSLVYIDVGASRGLVSDISEGGLGVLAVASEIEAHISTVAFRLPRSQDRVEIRAWVDRMPERR